MSIYQQVEDAQFLKENGRHLGALTILVLAVAASSKKCFPQGTKSLEEPTKNMGDSEAFTQFLGGRIRKLLFGDYAGPEFGTSGILVPFREQKYDISYILYKFYRCELVHQADLPEDVAFQPSDRLAQMGLHIGTNEYSIAIVPGNIMALDYGWIDLLIRAVVQAPCNGTEFGIKYYKLLPKPNLDESVLEDTLVAKHAITPGRYHILKAAVRFISPEVIDASDDDRVVELFGNLVASEKINGGAITGLSSHGLTDRIGRLQPKGLAILREIAEGYTLVEV